MCKCACRDWPPASRPCVVGCRARFWLNRREGGASDSNDMQSKLCLCTATRSQTAARVQGFTVFTIRCRLPPMVLLSIMTPLRLHENPAGECGSTELYFTRFLRKARLHW